MSIILDDDAEQINLNHNQKKRLGKPKDKVWEYFRSIDIPNSSHKGAQCSFRSQNWKREKPNDMKAHLALRCSMVTHSVKLEYLHIVINENISEQTVQNQSKNQSNKENNDCDFVRTDRALVRFFVCCEIPFFV